MPNFASVRLPVKPVCCRACNGSGQDPSATPEEEPFPCRQCDGQGYLVYLLPERPAEEESPR
jgi:DnaJ-class molecular chaperone